MKVNKILAKVSLILGLLALIWLILSALALADINQNIEPNLNMEWVVVVITLPILLLFIVLSSITIFRIMARQ